MSNLHEETSEEDLTELFADYGPIKNVYLNLDRRSGFCKGYALIEYEHQKEAQVNFPSFEASDEVQSCSILTSVRVDRSNDVER